MVKTEKIIIREKEYIRTYSDASMMIERDGHLYEEAIDPVDSGRIYTETDQPIVHEAEAEEADYLQALERFGVK